MNTLSITDDAPTTYEWLQSIGMDAGMAMVDDAELTICAHTKHAFLEIENKGHGYIDPGCTHRIDLPYPQTRRDVLELLTRLQACWDQ